MWHQKRKVRTKVNYCKLSKVHWTPMFLLEVVFLMIHIFSCVICLISTVILRHLAITWCEMCVSSVSTSNSDCRLPAASECRAVTVKLCVEYTPVSSDWHHVCPGTSGKYAAHTKMLFVSPCKMLHVSRLLSCWIRLEKLSEGDSVWHACPIRLL